MRSLVVGEQPPGYEVGNAYHYILMRILMAGRANDLQVIDGPYLQIRDVDGFRRVGGRAAALGVLTGWHICPHRLDECAIRSDQTPLLAQVRDGEGRVGRLPGGVEAVQEDP